MGLSAATAADMLTKLGRMSSCNGRPGHYDREEQIFTAYAQSLPHGGKSFGRGEKQALVNEVIASSASLVADAAAWAIPMRTVSGRDAASKNAKQALGEVFAEDAAKQPAITLYLDKIAAGLLKLRRHAALHSAIWRQPGQDLPVAALNMRNSKKYCSNQSVVNATLRKAAANTLANQMAHGYHLCANRYRAGDRMRHSGHGWNFAANDEATRTPTLR